MRRALIALLTLIACTAPAAAQTQTPRPEPELPAAIAEPEISVGSDYRGSAIDVWGVNTDRRGRGDIVVVVRGPNQGAIVMRKARAYFMWVNGPPVTFSEAPAFFAVISNRSLRQIASPAQIWALQMDPAASARLSGGTPPGASPADYRAALVRLRRVAGLYQERRNGIVDRGGGLFSAHIQLPANAPIATYIVDTYVFRDGRLISSKRGQVQVSRVGIERRIHDLASNASVLYGLLTVLLALGAGWISALVFRRG